MSKIEIVLGGSGMIGFNLVSVLSKETNTEVFVVDRRTPDVPFPKKVTFLSFDIFRESGRVMEKLARIMGPADEVRIWHLAANSDIRLGIEHLTIDLSDTLGTTAVAIELARKFGASTLAFSSSSAIYGDLNGEPVSEEYSECIPVSNYGRMKLWSENLIRETLEFENRTKCVVFRFPNVVGNPQTHGVLSDFYAKLLKNPTKLEVLGNGNQTKQYMHVSELVDIVVNLTRNIGYGYEVINIAPDDLGVSVREIANMIVNRWAPGALITYGDTNVGWVGDIPCYRLATRKLKDLGIRVTQSSKNAVGKAINELENSK